MGNWLKGGLAGLLTSQIYLVVILALIWFYPDEAGLENGFGWSAYFEGYINYFYPLSLPVIFIGVAVGFLYDWLHNPRRERWLKGAVVGIVVSFIATEVLISGAQIYNFAYTDCYNSPHCSLGPALFLLIYSLPISIIGGVIGGVYGWYKSRPRSIR